MKETDWDRFTVHIKKEVVEELKNSYAAFGWNLVQEQEHPQYSDTKVLYFTRPHFLMHKDALQFLQASFEIAFNQTGKLEDKKKERSTIVGITGGLSAAFLIGIGIWLISLKEWAVVIGFVLVLIGLIGAIVIGFCILKMYRLDCKTYTKQIEDEKKEMERICQEARRLRENEATTTEQ